MCDEETVLRKLFLFEGMDQQELQLALGCCTPIRLHRKRGDILYAPDDYPHALSVILSGRCDVLQGDAILNTLEEGDSFGILSLYSRRSSFPTKVVVKISTELLQISRDDVDRMIAAYPCIAVNIIRFLTDRLEFLQERTAAFTEPDIGKRVAAWLLRCDAADGLIVLNRQHTARMLGCSRATLYRALDQLEHNGWVKNEEAGLRLIHKEELERMIYS